MHRLLNPQTKAERSATIKNSLSCDHVHQDFCCRRATGAFFGRSNQLSWTLQAHFCHRIISKLRICSEKAKNCVLSQLPIRKPTRKARRFWIRLGRTQQWWRNFKENLVLPIEWKKNFKTDSHGTMAIFLVLYSKVVLSKSSVSLSILRHNWSFAITCSMAKANQYREYLTS